MKHFTTSKMRRLRMLVRLKNAMYICLGFVFFALFCYGAYHLVRKGASYVYHTVIHDSRYDLYNYRESISDEICFYENGAHGYLMNIDKKKIVLEDVKWVVSTDDSLACYASKGFRGYLNVHTGSPVILADRYIKAWVFSEGMAGVMEKDSTIKFIDRQGNVKLEKDFKYSTKQFPYVFHDGLCIMTDASGLCGLIDRLGEWRLMPEYDLISYDEGGFWIIEKGDRKGLCDKFGKQILPVEYLDVNVLENGISIVLADYTMQMMNFDGTLKYSFICTYPEDLYYASSEEDEYGNERQVLAPCKVYNTYAGRCGLLSPAGRPLTSPLYTSISAISNNLYFCTFDYSDQGIFVDGSGNVVNDGL